MQPELNNESKIWQGAFFCFVLAAFTGFLYRLGMLGFIPFDLSLQNIRHAHSHLMFFGWASLLPLYIIFTEINENSSGLIETKIMKYSLWTILGFGLLSFPFFLVWGYQPVPVGENGLPLSVIFSGMVMIGWYLFIAGYLAVRSKNVKAAPWFDASLLMLFICSLGAWGVAVMQAVQPENHLYAKALTHFFLSTFTEGWVVLVLIGIILKGLDIRPAELTISPTVLISLIAIGAPLTFPYGISQSLLTPSLSIAARIGGILVGTGVVLSIYSVFKSHSIRKTIWVWPLGFLLVKGMLQITASVVPSGLWLSDHGLRILYLHILLLGAFTLGAIAYLHERITRGRHSYYGVVSSILVLILTLILPTRLWPDSLGGTWIFYAMAGAALLPALTILSEWLKLKAHQNT